MCQGLFFDKVADLRPATLLKKRLWHRRFPVDFAHLFYRILPVAASEVYFLSHQKNTVCEYKLNWKSTMKYKQTFSLVSDIDVEKTCFLM